jgi:hypothetical protein
MGARFLSARLTRTDQPRKTRSVDMLVLEFHDEHCALYYLSAAGKIEDRSIVKSVEDGLLRAKRKFGVGFDDWSEDIVN